MRHNMNPGEIADLATLVDENSLRRVITALVEIADERGRTTRPTDVQVSARWYEASVELDKLETRLTRIGV